MKYIILLLLIPFMSLSQTYRQAYDYTESLGGNGNSFSTNFSDFGDPILHNTERVYLLSYLPMYKTTNDLKWLNKFIIHSLRIQHHRDDQIQYFSNEVAGAPFNILSSVPNGNSPTWSTITGNSCLNSTQYIADILHTSSVSFAMAEFVHLVLVENPNNIQNMNLPTEANVWEPYPNQWYQLQTYYDYAVYLKIRIEQSIDYHINNYWCDVLNGYKGDYNKDCTSNDFLNNDPINYQCFFGTLLSEMYLVENSLGNYSLAQTYLNKITRIASIVLNRSLQLNSHDNSSYTWSYHLNVDNCIEDIQHAFLLMGFADICYQNNIPNYDNQNDNLFYSDEMQKLANAFSKHIYQSPLNFAQNTFGTCCICNGTTTTPEDDSYFYLFLAKYNPEIYQIVSDVFCERALYNNNANPAFAYLAEYENIFNPIAVNRCADGDSHWAGVAGGDFDGNGSKEFCTARNKDGAIEIYTVEPVPYQCSINPPHNTTIKPFASIINHSGPWAGITATDLDPTNPGDEIAAIDNGDGYLYLYKQSGNLIVQFASYNTGIIGTWTGISSGNFDGNSGKEIILSNSNGNVYVYRYTSGNLVGDNINTGGNFISSDLTGIAVGDFYLNNPGDEIATINNSSNGNLIITIYSFSGSSLTALSTFTAASGPYSQWNGITSGDFDGDGIAEIIAHRNYDGAFFIFKLNSSAQLVNNYKESFPVDQQNGIIGSARFSIEPSKDMLISLRNYDGNMFVFSMDGLCQGLKLGQYNNITIDNNTSIDNPYSNVDNTYDIDYHANNTLQASNVTITATSPVDFIAGKEIDLLPGFTASSGSDFHAYIDPNIYCSNHSTFRPVHNPNPPPSPITKKDTFYPNVTLFPNPTEGSFTVKVNTVETTNLQLVITDYTGRVLSEDNIHVGDNIIDKSNYEGGLYMWQVYSSNTIIGKGKLVISKNGQTTNLKKPIPTKIY